MLPTHSNGVLHDPLGCPAAGGRAERRYNRIGAAMNGDGPGGEPPPHDDEDPPAEATVLRLLLGTQLRSLREAAGIQADKAAHEIRASRSKISRMETGRVGFKLRDVEDLLSLYGVTGEEQARR